MNSRLIRWTETCGAVALALTIVSCSSSSSSSSPSQAPARAPATDTARRTPAPAAAAPETKANADIVEDTSTYYVQRYKKSDMVRVDETHIRSPYMAAAAPIYREDADYYYLRFEKVSKEEIDAAAAARKKEAEEKKAQALAAVEKAAKSSALVVTPEQFDSVPALRGKTGVQFQRAGQGLPTKGQWRQNIAVADIDGDGIPDIVTGAPRISTSTFHVFLGDGHGAFKEQPVQFIDEHGKPVTNLRLAYGGVAVADFDGDGKMDVATASHGDSVAVFLNRGEGRFQVVRGLPPSYSSQAIAAFDVNGDGHPDIVASRDMMNAALRRKEGKDYHQVRVFLNDGKGHFTSDDDAIRGACFSFNIFPIDVTGSGKRDLLTGCRGLGGWGLTWKNDGKGKFDNELFEIIEQAAYHFAVAPGSFGPSHSTAFADLYQKVAGGLTAEGLNVYFKDSSGWHKVVVWRKKGTSSRVTAVAMGDLNGDGLDDVVAPDRDSNKLRIFLQTKEGTFEEEPESAEPALDSYAVDIRLADLNGDGRLDIVLAKSVFSERPRDPGGVEVLLNEGSR